MTMPWENDPVANVGSPDAPWAKDPVVGDTPWKDDPEANQTTLFSKRGASSLFERIGPDIAAGVLAGQLRKAQTDLQDIDRAVAEGRAPTIRRVGVEVPITPEEIEKTRMTAAEKQRALEEYNRHVQEIQGTPSKPLELTSGAVRSVAQNLPGVLIGVATRGAGGPSAAAPAVASAVEQTRAHAYGEAQVPADSRRAPAGVDAASRHADISGAAEGLLEIIPTAKLLKDVGKEAFGRLVRDYVLREWATELPTTAIQDISEYVNITPEMPFGEFMAKLGQDLVDTAIVAPLAAGGTVAIAHGAARASRAPTAIGPSGEGIYGGNMENISPPTTPPVPVVPRPVPTQPVLTETQTLIASIDATLADPEGISDDQVEVAKQQIAAFEKARNSPPLAENTAILAGLDDITPAMELGQSAKSTRNAPNYAPNPNDDLPRSQRVVSYSTAQGVETGLSLAQTPLLPGVHVVGEPSSDREGPILQAAADTLEQWRAKFLPDRPLLLVNETLPHGNAVGWHWTNGNVHAITPAVLRKFTGQGSEAFNANAQVTFFYNLSHEFGHSLLEDRFFNEGIPQDLTQALKAESSEGIVSEPTLAALEAIDPARAAVVREYNSIRQRVMSNQMTAREFVLEWLGPHQAGKRQMFGKHDYAMPVPDEAPALQLIDKIMQRALGSKTPLPSNELNPMRADYLSLHEYAANQMARYAYARKWDESSPFNKDSLFARAFQSLRNALAEFFAFLKREGDIAPNTTFAEWLDGLSTSGDRTPRAGKKARAKPAPKKAPKAAKPKPVEELDHNAETVSADKLKYFRGLITGLVRDGTIEANDETFKRLMGLLKAADYSTFVDEIQPMLEKKVRFELDDVPDVKEVGLDTDPAGLVLQFGANMYQGNLAKVIVKELVQNSFDAVKSERNRLLKSNEQTEFYEPTVDVSVDTKARTVEVKDNGVGMTRDVLEKALLTYPGSSKTDLTPEESSGGLGLAKVVILFVPTSIRVETVHNGQKTVMEATPKEIIAKTAKATVTRTDEPNGTKVIATLPEQLERPSGMEPVELEPYTWNYPVLEKGLLGVPGKFTLTGDGYKQDIKAAPQYPHYQTLDFKWGEVELYVGEQEKQWGGTASVYSSGLWQFDTDLKMLNNESLPFDTQINIKPHVTAKDSIYPFENNRQGLRPHVFKGMGEVLKELTELVIKRRLEKAVSTYSNIQILTEDGLRDINIETTQDEKGRPKMTLHGVEPTDVLWHNNTTADWFLIDGARELMHRIGGVFYSIATKVQELKPETKPRLPGAKAPMASAPTVPRYYAIGIDRSFYGMNMKLPYNMIMLNPLAGKARTVEGVAEELYQTIMHEIAHNYVWDHNADFANALAEVQVVTSDNGLRGTFYNLLRDALRPSFNTYQTLRNVFHDSGTENSGPSVEGRERYLIANDSIAEARRAFGARSEPDAGPGDTRGRYSAGDIHYELDGLGEPVGFGVPAVRVAAGLPEDAARRPDILADAQRQWQQLGFRSPYFKAWFGDWEQREGSKVVTAGDTPLAVYHASDSKVKTPRGWEPFTRFEQGDMGFHFGTLRAAHNRGFGGPLNAPETPVRENGRWIADAFENNFAMIKKLFGEKSEKLTLKESYIIPTVLNIRNPIVFGEENPGMWVSPRAMLAQMAIAGVSPFSLQEANRIIQATEALMESTDIVPKFHEFRPLREALLAKGFDGMQYINTQEGDISWVAFKPEQIKSLLGNKTFSKSKDFHWELDFDQASPDGYGASRMNRLFGKWMPAQFRRSLRWITNLQYKTLQLQQLAHLHPDLTDLAYMNEKNYEYNRYKGSLQAQPDQVLAEWSELGKENFAKVNKFLQMEAEGGVLWFDLVQENNTWTYRPNAMTLQKMEEFGLQPQSPEGEALGKLILDAKNALLHQINEAHLVLKYLTARGPAGKNHAALSAKLTILAKEIHEIRKRPFFPQGRFGNYILTVEKKRDGAAGYEVVYREAFESREEWEEAWQKANSKAKPDEHVRKFELTDTEYVMMSLPQDFIEIAVSELGLTEEQRDTLIAITQPVRREKALRSYDQSRLGLKGYSTDAMRSFANFTWHNANLLAKLRYRSEFNMAIQGINSKLRDAQFSAAPESIDEVERLTRVKRYMERSRDFIMAPPNEAHLARAFVSIAYLGFNIKTAIVNFYGLVTTWSDITSKLGQIEGNKLFLKATRGMWASIRLTDLNAVKPSNALSEELQAGLDRAVQDGVLTQSYAYHLAGMANASNLYRMPSRQVLGKMTHKAIDLAMWTFRLAELGARRATFIAQLDIAKRQGDLGFDDAYTLAVTATNKLQNDYSLGNRVPFMRGIKTQSGNPLVEGAVPMATIFLSFAQHMAFHAYGGYELGIRRGIRETAKQAGVEPPKIQNPLLGGYTMKIWLLTLLLAGYEGLPGAENILDLVDMLWKKLKGKPARQEMREMVQAVGVDPVWAARGLGHNVAGFDISRSLGFGRVIPGTDVLNKTQTDINRTVGSVVFDLAGPTGNMIHWGLSTFAGDRPMAEGMKRAPGALGNVWNAYTWSQQGVRSPSGAQITFDLETGKPRDLTTVEVFGKALGFNPTIVSQNREILFQQHDLRMYWLSRRDLLLDDMWRATWQRDREAIADVNKAIQQFNGEIPDEYKRSLRISPRDIFNSRRTRARTKRLEELQLPSQRRYRELYRDVRESFEAP